MPPVALLALEEHILSAESEPFSVALWSTVELQVAHLSLLLVHVSRAIEWTLLLLASSWSRVAGELYTRC